MSKPKGSKDIWLTKQQAAEKLQMSEKTIDRLAAKGVLVREMRPVVGKGDLPHFRLREIKNYIKKQTGRHEPKNLAAQIAADTISDTPAADLKPPDATSGNVTLRVEIQFVEIQAPFAQAKELLHDLISQRSKQT